MNYRLRLGSSARRELLALPTATRRRVRAALDLLTSDPRPRGTQALKGKLRGLRKLRVGDYRIVYEVDDEAAEVRVRGIAHRRGAGGCGRS